MIHDQVFHLPVPAQQSRAVGGVENQEIFVGQAAAKMSAQQWKYVMFGVDHRTQHAVPLFKAYKLHIAVGFTGNGLFYGKGCRGIGVAQHLGSPGSPVKAQPGKAQQF